MEKIHLRVSRIQLFGKRAFRRPLTDGEVARYERLFAARSSDFLDGARLVVETMLQSPHFLFHLSTGAYATARGTINLERTTLTGDTNVTFHIVVDVEPHTPGSGVTRRCR